MSTFAISCSVSMSFTNLAQFGFLTPWIFTSMKQEYKRVRIRVWLVLNQPLTLMLLDQGKINPTPNHVFVKIGLIKTGGRIQKRAKFQ